METTLIIFDEVNCQFKGLDPGTRRKMVNELKFFIPQARHMPAFKLGRWDGCVSFFNLNGSTQINLLDRVLPIVVEAGYEVEIEDYRNPFDMSSIAEIDADYWVKKGVTWPKGHDREGQDIVLREHQVDIVNTFIKEPQSIVEAATGAGKTLITATLSDVFEPLGRTLVIVPSKSLVNQTERDYKNVGLDVGVYYGERKETDHKHIIATWQSLEILNKAGKGMAEEDKPFTQFAENIVAVIVDEVHSAKANVLRGLLTGPLSHCPIRLGLTGTLPKDEHDYLSLYSAIGFPASHVKAKELQEKGILSNCNINVIQTKETKVFKDYHQEREYLTKDKDRLAWLAEFVKEISNTGNTFVLVQNIQTGEMLQEFIEDSTFIYGATSLEDRKEKFDSIATSDNQILISSYGISSTGIDVPRIFNLVLLEPGKSFTKVIQSIGRGIRRAHDKDFVQIWDICGDTKYSKRHLTQRKAYYREAQYPFKVSKVDWM